MKLAMAPGDTDHALMLAGVRDGVLIESMRGTRAGNPYSGQIRGGINLGYRIERGEVTDRVVDWRSRHSVLRTPRSMTRSQVITL